MAIIVYSKGALDKYFSIFEQTKADMIVRSENVSLPLHWQKLRKQNSLSAAPLIGCELLCVSFKNFVEPLIFYDSDHPVSFRY